MSSGHIELILGPMFSGKSSELIRRVRRYGHSKKNCVSIRFAHDNRYSDDHVSSHDRQMLKAMSAVKLSELEARIEEMSPDVVAVDEGQMFPDIVEFCDAQANRGRVVIISALDGDFRRKPFGRILELVPMAEKVDKLTSVCVKCYGEAAFTERTIASQELIVIGAGDIYKPVCRKCFDNGVLIAQASSSSSSVSSGAGVNTTPQKPTLSSTSSSENDDGCTRSVSTGSVGSISATSTAIEPPMVSPRILSLDEGFAASQDPRSPLSEVKSKLNALSLAGTSPAATTMTASGICAE